MPLGKLKQIPTRKQWPEEDKYFTPWLSSKEGMEILGETLGMELELHNTEVSVGNYRADIVAKDTLTNSNVVIENQLSQTDHDHIGKLLTYAASFDAKAIIWIAQSFRDEHRQTIDWLNNITIKDIDFYGIEIELLQIGNSPYAPNFKLICKPNEGARVIRTGTLTKGDSLKLDFWKAFNDYLTNKGKPINIRTALPQQWYDVSIGNSWAHISLTLRTAIKDIGCEVNMNGDDAKEIFHSLFKDRAVIEKATGPLEWNELPESKSSRIIARNNIDPTKEDNWNKCFKWYLDLVAIFRKEFVPRIRRFY